MSVSSSILLVLPKSAVEIKENCHLIRHLELRLVLDYFSKKFIENETAIAIANTLTRASDRKEEGSQEKGLEVASVDLSEDEIENFNGLMPVVTVLMRCKG